MARRSGTSVAVRAPFAVGDRVVSNYRVPPFLSDEVLTVAEARNNGTKARPSWRVLCRSPRGVEGWLDGDTLTPMSVIDTVQADALREMQEQLARAGFDPGYARQLQDEGMGPHELASRLAIPSGVGTLRRNIRRRSSHGRARTIRTFASSRSIR